MKAPAILFTGIHALAVAERLRGAFEGALLHAPYGARGLQGKIHRPWRALPARLSSLLCEGRPVLAVAATGIVVRALMRGGGYMWPQKGAEGAPVVVAVSADGAFSVPLLGGHDGANALAKRTARALKGKAVLTTATETCLGIPLNPPPAGFQLVNRRHYKGFASRLLAGEKATLQGHAPFLAAAPFVAKGAAKTRLTLRVTIEDDKGAPSRLVYAPRRLVLGMGCVRGADPDKAAAAAFSFLERHGFSKEAVAAVASVELKCDEPAVHAAAAALGVEALFFTPRELARQNNNIGTPSPAAMRALGVPSVSEAAGLCACGEGGRLLAAKVAVARNFTFAVAAAKTPLLKPALGGRRRGRLDIIGLGSGGFQGLTLAAVAALEACDDIVGYAPYLAEAEEGENAPAPCSPWRAQRHPFAIGQEKERARHALDLAAQGRRVALVSSGDCGVYAMASPLFQLLAERRDTRRAQAAIGVIPGVSAMQAASAAAGAVLGHDFCAVSLSTLLTPWPLIARRLQAAMDADFALALYNPSSRGRRHIWRRARLLLQRHLAPATPVVAARRLGRHDETVRLLTLAALGDDDADMHTTLLIGNKSTRFIPEADAPRWAWTPRAAAANGAAADGAAAKNTASETP